jgi:biofilm PGA synthesis protein PgaA
MIRIDNKAIITTILIVVFLGVALLGIYSYVETLPSSTTADEVPVTPTQAQGETRKEPPLDKAIQASIDIAVGLARNGQFDQALTELAKLHNRYPQVEPVTRDYLAVLSWAGHDEEATRLYETIPADQPDYVLAAAGHSYRVQKQPEKALAAYRLGEQKYPDSVLFVDGELRSLISLDRLGEAAKRADSDLSVHGNRPEIVAAKADIVQLQIREAHDKAAEFARNGDFDASFALFHSDLLDAEHTGDPGIRRDYLAALGWAGKHDDQVLEIYKTLKEDDQNVDYVLGAAAKAWRNKRHSDKALEIYRRGMRLYPDNTVFAMGEIDCLLDLHRTDEAGKRIKTYEAGHGSSAELEAAKRSIAQIKFMDVRSKAARLARQGHFNEGLAVLQKLGGEHANNTGIQQDRIAIYGWMGGHDRQVVDMYLALKNPNQPDYVMEAVGKAYRDLGLPEQAAEIYERGLKRYPHNEILAVGAIRTLTEAGYIDRALAAANEDLNRNGNRLEVLIAAAEAANQYNLSEALRYYQLAAQAAPKDPNVLRGLIRTSDRLGAPEVALKTAYEHPGVISESERRMIEGDEIAALVRLGMLEQDKNPRDFAGTDRAIDEINGRIAEWQKEGADAHVNVQRARYDRIIALHNRLRFQDVANEFEILSSEGADMPPFTLGAVGDAYLDMHQPEKARDVYLKILAVEPKNNLVRRQLFYAYVDLGEYKNAYRIADEMAADGTVWNRKKNEVVPMTDAEHRDAELTAGAARLYFGEVTEADRRLLPVIAANLSAPAAHEALGNLDNAHQLPRAALEEYESGRQLAGGQDLSNEVGIANTQLALHNYREAGAEIESLTQRYPENLSVQRAKRDWDVYNSAEFDLTAGYAVAPTTTHNVNGGEAYGIDAKIYSAPFAYNWRLFAGEFFSHQKEPNSEGFVGYTRSTAGVEYRNGPTTAEIAPTYNAFHGTERVGVAADATQAIDDHWTIAGSGEMMSRETPLRALNKGVTADLVNAHALWQQDESRSVRFGGGVMPFSDGNFRSEQDADFTQRLWTQPFWRVDALASAGADQNSKNENRSYYNPKSDFIGLIGARIIQTLYQRYSTLWQHSLQVTPGAYWQQNFGTDAAVRARYEQRVFLDQSFESGLGVNFQRQSYDGAPENDVSFTLDLVDHF